MTSPRISFVAFALAILTASCGGQETPPPPAAPAAAEPLAPAPAPAPPPAASPAPPPSAAPAPQPSPTGPPRTGPPPEPRASVDPSLKWDCPFPSLAERGMVREADVMVEVIVDADGTPLGAEVLEDPGHGYAAAAKKCVMAARGVYVIAKDESGKPVRAKTYPFKIHFVMK